MMRIGEKRVCSGKRKVVKENFMDELVDFVKIIYF